VIGKVFYVTFHPPKMSIDKIRDEVLHDSREIYSEISVVTAGWIKDTASVVAHVDKSVEVTQVVVKEISGNQTGMLRGFDLNGCGVG